MSRIVFINKGKEKRKYQGFKLKSGEAVIEEDGKLKYASIGSFEHLLGEVVNELKDDTKDTTDDKVTEVVEVEPESVVVETEEVEVTEIEDVVVDEVDAELEEETIEDIINAFEDKDELEAFIKEKFDVDVDKRKGIDKLKTFAIELAKG